DLPCCRSQAIAIKGARFANPKTNVAEASAPRNVTQNHPLSPARIPRPEARIFYKSPLTDGVAAALVLPIPISPSAQYQGNADRRDGMQLESLKIFCDVVRWASFSRGAAENDISQSSASQAVHQLELRLGVKLIDRSKRPLVLTPHGKVYYEGC